VAERRCEAPDCEVVFEPKRPAGKYHSATCRQRAARARKAAESNVKDEAKTDTPAEHGLVRAVRTELETADRLNTVAGQLALQLARRAANPDESSLMALSKEIRAVMADALAGAPPKPGGSDADGDSNATEQEDEVDAARRKREEARKAAGLS
jgi:hypothetical protein